MTARRVAAARSVTPARTGRRTVALLAAALVAVTGVVGLPAAPADAATPAATVVVAPDGGGIVRSKKDLGLSVTVTNTGTEALDAGRIAVSLGTAPVASTSTLLGQIAKPSQILLGLLTPATAVVPSLQPGDSTTVRTKIDDETLANTLTGADGARLLYVRYRTPALQQVAESAVVKMGARTDASVGLGTVVPVLAPAGETGLVDAATQARLTTPDGTWSLALRAALADPAATVALDPSVIASIRILGQAAPQEASAFLDALSRLPNEVVRLPYADADITLERAAGLRSAPTPTSFAGVAAASAAAADGTTPAPTASAAAGVAPPAADLTSWNWSDRSVAWPVPHTASASTVAALARSGDAVLLPSDDVVDSIARRASGPLARAHGARLLVADATASSLLVTASGEGPAADAALATLVSLLATAAATRETTGLLATVGRSSATPRLDRVLSLITRQSWVHGRTLAELESQVNPASVTLPSRSAASSQVGTAKSLLLAEQKVQDLGRAITSDAATVTAPQRLALIGMLSAAWRSDDPSWRTAASRTAHAFADLTAKVHLVPGSTSNAIGTDGRLGVVVVNELPQPVKVVVRASVSNGRLQFTGDSKVEIAVPADAQNHGQLAFRTITNGSTDVTLSIHTPAGVRIGPSVPRTVTVRAGFDTIVAVVLVTALALLLALGVYRNVTRRRRPKAVEA